MNKKKTAIYIVGGMIAFAMALPVGYVLASWLFQGRGGAVLGTKAKKLELANYIGGYCETFNQYLPNYMYRPEMVAGTRYDLGACVKPNKALSTVTYSIENLVYSKNGVVVGPSPETGDGDLGNKISIFISEADGGTTAYTINSLKATGVTLPWNGEVADATADFVELDYRMDADVEIDPTLNGYSLTFDLVATGTE